MKKSMIIGKRQVVLAVLIVALAAAVYLNWRFAAAQGGLDLTGETTSSKQLGDAQYVNQNASNSVPAEDTYFAQAKTDRDKSQSDALKILQDVVNDAKSSAEAKAKASADISQMAKNIEWQSAVENLIKAKDFENGIVIITGDQVNVIVKTSALLDTDILQIQDIVTGQTKLPLDNIKIVERK